MQGSTRTTRDWERHVDALSHERGGQLGGGEFLLTGGHGLVDGPAGLADALAGLLAGLRRQRADLAVGQGQRRGVAGMVEACLLQLGSRPGGRDGSQRRVHIRIMAAASSAATCFGSKLSLGPDIGTSCSTSLRRGGGVQAHRSCAG